MTDREALHGLAAIDHAITLDRDTLALLAGEVERELDEAEIEALAIDLDLDDEDERAVGWGELVAIEFGEREDHS